MIIDHVHQYRRIDIASKPDKKFWVMKCINCTHYTPMKTKLSAPRLWGTKAVCNRCKEEFILDRRALRMSEPCCFLCVERKESDASTSPDTFFDELEKSLRK